MVYNAVNDIFFGHYADNVNHKLGRRLPFIRYGAPLFGLSVIYFWFPLPGTFPGDLANGQWMKFFQLLTGYLFYDTMLTIVILSVVSLPPEMTESTEERTSLALYDTVFSAIGGISIFIVPIIMGMGLEIFRISIIIIAVIGASFYVVCSYLVKERSELSQNINSDSKKEHIGKEIWIAIKNKTFVSFLIYNFCIFFIFTMVQGFTPFFANIHGLGSADSTLILIGFYSGYVVGLPIFVIFSKRIEMRTLIILITLICIVGLSSLFVIDLIYNMNVLYWIVFFFNGLIMSMLLFQVPYIADALDIDELNTGRRREGVHFGINAMIQKPGEQLPLIMGASILLLTGYIQGAPASDQPDSAIFGLKLMITIIPILFCILILISQLINPLKGEYIMEMKENLLNLHEEKERKHSD